jgi:L,D-transpeptidase ErfK/SrfK
LDKITAARTVIPEPRHLPALIGRLQQHRVESGETLLDIARDAGLGFQELQDANPKVDEWVPKTGADIVIPSRWILPRSRYRGLVINIAEMRLYLFPKRARPGASVAIRTWPVGIGTDHAPSPVGPFTVRSKDKNPTWIVPASIQQGMDEPRGVVPPGPDNPLGGYRIRLSKGLYEIHGTDVPWSIGRQTTHGCIRLYPEHIAELYTLVQPGTPGELIYQPVKFGEDGGQIYVQVHRDLYHRIRNLEAYALTQAKRAGIADRVDRQRLRAAVGEQNGIPTNVTRSGAQLLGKASRPDAESRVTHYASRPAPAVAPPALLP